MLRLAVARSSRRYAPATARWRRLNSTKTPDMPGKPETGTASKAAEQSENSAEHSSTAKTLKGKAFTAPTTASTSAPKTTNDMKVPVEEATAPKAPAAKGKAPESEVHRPAAPSASTSEKPFATPSPKNATEQAKNASSIKAEEVAQVVKDTKGEEVAQVTKSAQVVEVSQVAEGRKAEGVAPVAKVAKAEKVEASLGAVPSDVQPTIVAEDVISDASNSGSAASASKFSSADPERLSEESMEVEAAEVDEPSVEELKRELLKEVSIEGASEMEPSRTAISEAELFGLTDKMAAAAMRQDPKNLPIRQQLDPNERNYTEEEWAATLVHGRSIHLPFFHPRSYDIPVASLHFRSHHVPLLDLFTHFATHAASSLGIPTSRVVYLPTQRSMWTVLRSPFIYKKTQENFERRVHKRGIKAWDADPEVVDRWVKYLRRHAMGGVGLRVVKWQHMPVGVGATNWEQVKHQLGNPKDADDAKIKALSEQIIRQEIGIISAEAKTPAP